jgi:hypothetical protein
MSSLESVIFLRKAARLGQCGFNSFRNRAVSEYSDKINRYLRPGKVRCRPAQWIDPDTNCKDSAGDSSYYGTQVFFKRLYSFFYFILLAAKRLTIFSDKRLINLQSKLTTIFCFLRYRSRDHRRALLLSTQRAPAKVW